MAKKKTIAQRIAADPALKAKYLSNPGLRSKLPANALNAKQRQQRILNTRLAQPVTPGSTVTNRNLAREANSATALRYGPQERDLATQQAQAQQQGTDVSGWYDAYLKELQSHAQNAQAINTAATQQIQQTGQGLRALDQTTANQEQGAAAVDAATRGATVDPSLATNASNASLVRQAMLAGFANQQAMSGASSNRYADTLAHVVAPGQKLQAQAQSAAGVRAVADKLSSLKSDEGQYNQTYRAGRVADEGKNVLAQQALGLDVAKAKTSASTDAAKIDIARGVDPVTGKAIVKPQSASDKKTAADLAYFKAHGYYPSTGKPKANSKTAKKIRPATGPGSLPAASEDRKATLVKQYYGLLSTPTKTTVDANGNKTSSPATPSEVIGRLQSGGVDPDLLTVARSLLTNHGKLDKAGVAAAHRAGLHVGGRWKITTAPAVKVGAVQQGGSLLSQIGAGATGGKVH